jgi:hypothetical protein
VRVHRVKTDRAIQLAEGAFAAEDPAVHKRDGAGLCARGADGGFSGIVDVSGGRKPDLNDVESNSSLYHSRVQVPVLIGKVEAGTRWIATLVLGAAKGSKATWERQPKVDLDTGGGKLTVETQSGTVVIELS